MQITPKHIEDAMAAMRQQRDAAMVTYHRNEGALLFAESLLRFLAQPEANPQAAAPIVQSADNVAELKPAAE